MSSAVDECLTVGTWKSEPGQVRQAVAFALKDGYRHIDAALIYGNEHEVGQGIKDSGIPRKDIFITSKLWNTHHPNAREGLQKTLDALDTDYLDLYVRRFFLYRLQSGAVLHIRPKADGQLIHWPVRLVPVSLVHP